MEHGILGQNSTVGQNGTGQIAQFHLTPKGVSFFPHALVGPFYPTPIPHTKLSVTKVIKRF